MIVVAPTALKGTISARAAANALAEGIRSLGFTDVVEIPVSDGGPGLVDSLASDHTQVEYVSVQGPLGKDTDARMLRHRGVTILESADACGLHLVKPEDREPLRASTWGVGQLLRAAEQSSQDIVIGLGGSATMDAGIGMAGALGWGFIDAHGRALPPLPSALQTVAHLKPPAKPWSIPVTALADVRTPLYGPNGAARVFGPQKGADDTVIELIDRGFERFAGVIAADLGVSVGENFGDGAAGGLGAAVRVFLHGQITAGSEWVLQQVGSINGWAGTPAGHGGRQLRCAKCAGQNHRCADRGVLARGVPVLLITGRVEGELPKGVRAITAAPGRRCE
jgi:glycerate kinase